MFINETCQIMNAEAQIMRYAELLLLSATNKVLAAFRIAITSWRAMSKQFQNASSP